MKNAAYILRNLMQATLDMKKPKANLMQLMTQVEAGYKVIEAASIVRNDDIVTKRQLSINEIFDNDSLVPDALKVPKPVKKEIPVMALVETSVIKEALTEEPKSPFTRKMGKIAPRVQMYDWSQEDFTDVLNSPKGEVTNIVRKGFSQEKLQSFHQAICNKLTREQGKRSYKTRKLRDKNKNIIAIQVMRF
jgi:hypothetical protein